MINQVHIKSFGPIRDINWNNLQNINLVIGKNGTGKTTLLKALYSAIRSVEQFKRGDEPKSINDILSENLYWTFQVGELGRLVNKAASSLTFEFNSDSGEKLKFVFGDNTANKIGNIENTFLPRDANSIFIPAKEILSLQHSIIRSREERREFGFDNTYYDLAKALTPPIKGRNYTYFSKSRIELKKAIGGRLVYEDRTNTWWFKDENNKKYPIGLTSEGVKKISILDSLLGNHYLSSKSLIFIDEPESALHPELISQFMDIILSLAKNGVQFFIATHSYFVIKKLYVEAVKQNIELPVLSFEQDCEDMFDIRQGVAETKIVQETIKLYEQEIEL